MLARCIQHETDHLDGVLFVDRLDAETRKAAHAGDPRGRVVRRAGAARSSSARTPRRSSGRPPREAGLRRHARSRRARRCAPCSTRRARGGRRRHPARRAAAGRGRTLAAVAGRASWPPRPASPVLTPGTPGDPEFLARLAELAAGLLPGRRLRRAAAAGGAGHPAARLGEPALLAAAGLAGRGAGAARHAARRRRHRRVDLPDRGRASTPARCSACVTEPIGPRDTAGDLLDRLAAAGAGLLVATLDGIEDGSLVRACRSPPTASRSRRKITVDDAAGRLDAARARASTGWSARCTPAPGRLDDVPRRAAQARARSRLHRRDDARRPASCVVEPRRACWSAPATAASRSATVQPPGKQPMPAADWARGARIEPGNALAERRGPAATATGGPAADAGPRRPPRPTRRGWPPTTAARGRRDGRLRQPVLPRLLRERRLDGRDAALATELATARCGRRAPSTRSSRRASTGRCRARRRRPATCCGSAPTSCCAPASRRTPRSPPPSTSPGPSGTAARPASSTPCCARSPRTTRTAWIDRARRRTRRRSAAWRCATAHPELDRRRRSPTRWRRPGDETGGRPGRRRRPARDAPGRLARARSAATSWPPTPAATPARTRPTRCAWTGGDPAPRRGARAAAPACRTRAASSCALALARAPLDGPGRALARPVRRPRRQGRPARPPWPPIAGATLDRRRAAPAPRRAGAHGRPPAWSVDGAPSATAATPGLPERQLRPGAASTRRAPASARCAAGRRRAGAAARTTSPSWPRCSASCSTAALRLVRPGGVVAYVDLLAAPGRDHRRRSTSCRAGTGRAARRPAALPGRTRPRRRPARAAVAAPARHRRDVLRPDPRLTKVSWRRLS